MINCIVAVDKNQGIGFQNSLPWPRISEDMKFFKSQTLNQIVIMGSNTWRSLPKKLSDRINIVISKFPNPQADHCFSNIEAALVFCQVEYPDKEVFIIGGQQLYDSTMNIIDRFYITEIQKEFNSDKFFNLNFVKIHFKKIKHIFESQDTVPFIIKEYSK